MSPSDKPAVTDLSDRAIQLARLVDRLYPGTYIIMILKPDIDAASWKVEIDRKEFIQKAALPKNSNGGLDTNKNSSIIIDTTE